MQSKDAAYNGNLCLFIGQRLHIFLQQSGRTPGAQLPAEDTLSLNSLKICDAHHTFLRLEIQDVKKARMTGRHMKKNGA
jgi:hypothetical protein